MKKQIAWILAVVLMLGAFGACTADDAGGSVGGGAVDAGSATDPGSSGGSASDAGSASGAGADTADYSDITLRVARQFGIPGSPAYVMEELGLLEKRLPGANLEFIQFAGGSAMNEALIAGELDAGIMGIPPALIAWDKGADFRIASGVSVAASELMVHGDKITSLADFTPADKIAVPSVGSIQHILLSFAAERELGDAKALDNNILAMANPDAYTALMSGTDITGHFAVLPFIDLELQAGATSLLTAHEAYGQDASLVMVVTKNIYENPVAYEGLMAALSEAIDLINARDPELVRVMAEIEQISEEDVLRYLDWEGASFGADVYGSMGLGQFMFEQGYISKAPASADDIMWPGANAVDN